MAALEGNALYSLDSLDFDSLSLPWVLPCTSESTGKATLDPVWHLQEIFGGWRITLGDTPVMVCAETVSVVLLTALKGLKVLDGMCVLDGMDCDTMKGAAAAADSGLLSDLLCGYWGYASDKRKLISKPSEGKSVLLIIQTWHHGQTHRPEHSDTLPELLMSCGCVSTNTTDAAVMAPCLRTYVWGFSPASWVIRK